MEFRGVPFQVGQTVTVLTDDAFVFVGRIVACHVKFECKCCEEEIRGKWDHEEEEGRNRRQTFLELNLDEEVELEEHRNRRDVVFQEGQAVFINLDQIIAIAQGSPPESKKML